MTHIVHRPAAVYRSVETLLPESPQTPMQINLILVNDDKDLKQDHGIQRRHEDPQVSLMIAISAVTLLISMVIFTLSYLLWVI
ncbi:hypothetical protein [Ectothiorhodospira shaposhnikovii]|uniref:hypothetical protein n=1 Tax=Ectothiorhodospira shaposhnikovii TaxID=1054 RepID=UPI00399FC408